MTSLRALQHRIGRAMGPGARIGGGLLLVVVLVAVLATPAASSSSVSGLAASGAPPAAFGQMPVRFEANVGQTDPEVRYLARGPGYTVFLTPREAVLSLARPGAGGGVDVVRLSLAGGKAAPEMLGLDRLEGHSNYYAGADPSQWREGVATYGRVAYRGVYPGIDLVFHGEGGLVKFDFVVAPGADPRVISVDVEGGEVTLAGGDLVIATPGGELRKPEPVVYQEAGGARRAVAGSYVLQGEGRFGFALGRYDADLPLVIDPALAYSAQLEGADPYRMAVDGKGRAYIHGKTTSATFPGRSAPVPTDPQVFVARLTSDGAALLYVTFLGSAGPIHRPPGDRIAVYGLDIDSKGNAYVGGDEFDGALPVVGPGATARDPAAPGDLSTCSVYTGCQVGDQQRFDGFLMRLGPGGQVTYSTYLRDHMRVRDLAVDEAPDGDVDVHLIGETQKTDMVTTANAEERTPRAPHVTNFGFVARVQPGVAGSDFYGYLSYFGMRLGMKAVAVDEARHTYLVGTLNWCSFTCASNTVNASSDVHAYVPISGNAFQPTERNKHQEPFASKLNTFAAPGGSLMYSTYLGGDLNCPGPGLYGGCQGAMDVAAHAGQMYVTGFTAAANFPTTLLPPRTAFQPVNPGSWSGFVSQIDPSLSGTASLVYSTYLGGADDDRASSIVVEGPGVVTVTGLTRSADFPISDPLPGQGTFRQGQATMYGPAPADGFVTTLDVTRTGPDGLVRSTFLGGGGDDHGRTLALDGLGGLYIRGFTASTDFPRTPGAFPKGNGDTFLTKVGTPLPEACPTVLARSAGRPSISASGSGPASAGLVGFGLLDGALGLSAWATAAVQRRRRRRTTPRSRPSVPARRARPGQGGFTLIELLVVIVILGIVSAVVVMAVRGSDNGRANAVATDDRIIRTAEEAYCAAAGQYGSIDQLTGGVAADNGQTYKFLSEGPAYHHVTAYKPQPPDPPGPCNGWRYTIGAVPPGSGTTTSTQPSPPPLDPACL